ncbi:MAG: hypothetical protein IKB22_00040, partial [Lentisphaeria bacterium]|nr:hypothetical protein [Lentisphaeria bacterium]
PLPPGAYLMTKKDAKIKSGTILAKVPRQQQKNKDITGGLPRVSELFEARIPKEVAEIASIDGYVELGKMARGRRTLFVRDPDSDMVREHVIPASKHLVVGKGDYVKKGQKLTTGSVVPQMLLSICGAQELQRYLVNEVQTVYRAQGVEINDKHIEIIIRQMMQKIRVIEHGDTKFLPGEQIDRYEFAKENDRVRAEGKKPAEGEPVLLGITKASLETESFISAASFQDTTRILTEAATLGKEDILRGFKENVITGHLIPAGTGSEKFQHVQVVKLGEELEPEVEETPEEQDDSKSPDFFTSEDIAKADFGSDDEDDDDDILKEEYGVDENELTDEFSETDEYLDTNLADDDE